MDPDQAAPKSGSTLFALCKNRFEKSARIFSRRHEQTTFSDAMFLGALRVKCIIQKSECQILYKKLLLLSKYGISSNMTLSVSFQ